MDTDLLVDGWIDDGHRLLAELVRSGFDVSAAAWVKTGQLGLWRLYVGSARVEPGKLGDAYGTLDGYLQRLPNLGFTIAKVRILPDSHPIARDLMEIRDRYPGGRRITRFADGRIGTIDAEEAYVYPRITAGLTREEVLETVTGLMRQATPVRPSLVTLRDGTVIRGEPFGLEVSRAGGPAVLAVKVRDAADGTARTIPADDVANIQ